MTRSLKGLALTEIDKAVEAATAGEDQDLTDLLCAQIDECFKYPNTRTRAYEEEHEWLTAHGFVHWMLLLQDGLAWMPERIPRCVLETWVYAYEPPTLPPDKVNPYRGYDGFPRGAAPCVCCATCRMVLPARGKALLAGKGWGPNCPVCGGSELWNEDLARAPGRHWITSENRRVRFGPTGERIYE